MGGERSCAACDCACGYSHAESHRGLQKERQIVRLKTLEALLAADRLECEEEFVEIGHGREGYRAGAR